MKISSKNLGKEIEVRGRIYDEDNEFYIVESYAKAIILNREIFKNKILEYARLKGELTLSINKKNYPEFGIKVKSYEA